MKDKIYIKTESGGLWENSPHMAFGIYMLVYLIFFFVSIFFSAFKHIPGYVLAVWLIFISVYLIVKTILMNQSKNMSKSTAFIKRDNKLYAVQLLYTHKKLGTEYDGDCIYMPSGTLIQGATLYNNFKVSKDVQTREKEVRARRSYENSFAVGLDDILKHINIKPKQYKILSKIKRSKLDNLFMYNIENAGMCTIMTSDANYNFVILNEPKIVKTTKKYFVIEYKNENGELCTSKFSNCYSGLIDEINRIHE